MISALFYRRQHSCNSFMSRCCCVCMPTAACLSDSDVHFGVRTLILLHVQHQEVNESVRCCARWFKSASIFAFDSRTSTAAVHSTDAYVMLPTPKLPKQRLSAGRQCMQNIVYVCVGSVIAKMTV
jgi:hypothetical protein